MPTKYTRQTARARALITRKGTTCTWYKAVNSTADDTTLPPEMQGDADPLEFTVPIVFYPQAKLSLATQLGIRLTGTVSNQLFAVIPGDVPFTPEDDDAVLINGKIQHVDTINTLQPDMTPIIYEVSFK